MYFFNLLVMLCVCERERVGRTRPYLHPWNYTGTQPGRSATSVSVLFLSLPLSALNIRPPILISEYIVSDRLDVPAHCVQWVLKIYAYMYVYL